MCVCQLSTVNIRRFSSTYCLTVTTSTQSERPRLCARPHRWRGKNSRAQSSNDERMDVDVATRCMSQPILWSQPDVSTCPKWGAERSHHWYSYSYSYSFIHSRWQTQVRTWGLKKKVFNLNAFLSSAKEHLNFGLCGELWILFLIISLLLCKGHGNCIPGGELCTSCDYLVEHSPLGVFFVMMDQKGGQWYL